MGNEVGTLKELNVKPGDVVYLDWLEEEDTVLSAEVVGSGSCFAGMIRAELKAYGDGIFDGEQFRIISRASDTPKTWGEMTDAEQRDISFAAMSGMVIELFAECAGYNKWVRWNAHGKTPLCEVRQKIRIKPEPKRETVTGWWNGRNFHNKGNYGDRTHRITFDTIDGTPDLDSIKMEEL